MAAFFDPSHRTGINLKDDEVLHLLGDGNLSDIEEFQDDDEELQPQFLEELDMEDIPLEDEPPAEDAEEGAEDDTGEEPTHVPSTSSQRRRPAQRKRVWKQMPFQDKPHEFPALPTRAVRLPIEYFRDYFDHPFFEEVARCTNLYYFRRSGKELKATADEIRTMFSIHMIMGCIPYPRIPMYWRQGTNLELVSAKMSRDRFLAMRNAFHVVDSDDPKESEKDNPLWKIQPMINQVKQTCNRLERVPGYYSNYEQMIPFTRMELAEALTGTPPRTRQEVDDGDEAIVPSGLLSLQYRPVIKPTESKRYDGFDHLPVVDRLNTPRSCRYEGCASRSKTRCRKCETYLCLSRSKNCFAAFHSK